MHLSPELVAAGSPQRLQTDTGSLRRNWVFEPSEPHWKKRVRHVQSVLLHRCARPDVNVIKRVFPATRWSVFFAYCPGGTLAPSQRFSLQRLRDLGAPLLVIVATRDAHNLPAELIELSDALYWKSLPGYDFSAYTIALEALAENTAGANVFLMNDSVYGPFYDITSPAFSSTWDLTGWTACGKFQNHVQSYAFAIKNFGPQRLDKLRSVFFEHFALSLPLDVVLSQETRLAKVAARSMSVGALWCPTPLQVDAPLEAPFALIRDGFPFLKKSLLSKYKHFQEADEVRAWLDHFQHPAPASE